MKTFESLDYCYDLLDYLMSQNNKFLAIFLQSGKYHNKLTLEFTGLESFIVDGRNLFIAGLELALNSINSRSKIMSKDIKINQTVAHIQNQSISYVVLFHDGKNINLIYSVENKQSHIILLSMLGYLMIINQPTQK